MHSNSYRAFDSINYAPLATLGVDVDWNPGQLLQVQQHSAADGKQRHVAEPSGTNVSPTPIFLRQRRSSHILTMFQPMTKHQMTRCSLPLESPTLDTQVNGVYRPRFKLDMRVIRVPVIPGVDPRVAYGKLADRNIRGVILEAFGVGNMPDLPKFGWLPWLRSIRKEVPSCEICVLNPTPHAWAVWRLLACLCTPDALRLAGVQHQRRNPLYPALGLPSTSASSGL